MQPSTLLYKNYVNLLIVWITAMNMLIIYKILIKIAPFEAYVPITEPTSLIVTSLKLFSLTIISLTFKAFLTLLISSFISLTVYSKHIKGFTLSFLNTLCN